MEYRWLYGEPDVIKIRQTFNDSIQAREWEHKVLRRIGVIGNDKWLNKGTGKAIPPHYGTHSKEWVLKRVEARKGYTHSEETKKKIGINSSLRRHSEETKRKIGEKLKGNQFRLGTLHSEEWKLNQSIRMTGENNSMFGKKQPTMVCEYCGIICSKTNHKRFHSNNCKKRIV